NDKVYGMTPPVVFFLAIFQQTANQKQIYLYDSAICQQLQNVQCHQNQVVTVTTWEDLCGAGQIDRHQFSVIKNHVYSAFWGFRYVRMYRFCTHVHSKKTKSSHIQDFDCSHAGNNQVSCSIQNASKRVGDSPTARSQGKR